MRREDAAASIQKVLENVVLGSIGRLLQQHQARHLGLAGGVFANVRLNRVLAEQLPIDEIFIFPAMGDEGLPAGGALCYLLQRDGLPHWLAQRHRLRDMYFGRDYTDAIDDALAASARIRLTGEPPVDGAARRLNAGQIGAIYTGRMEYGPRALGARSILANPARRETHDLLNRRLERSEFMPFAPVIAAEKAATVFDVNSVNAYACRFMTMTCNVKPQWRDRIAAVVHADGSARPQTIERDTNPLYYDILTAFERESGSSRAGEHELQRPRGADREQTVGVHSGVVRRTRGFHCDQAGNSTSGCRRASSAIREPLRAASASASADLKPPVSMPPLRV